MRPHTVRRLRLALGDGAATRVGFFDLLANNTLHIVFISERCVGIRYTLYLKCEGIDNP